MIMKAIKRIIAFADTVVFASLSTLIWLCVDCPFWLKITLNVLAIADGTLSYAEGHLTGILED